MSNVINFPTDRVKTASSNTSPAMLLEFPDFKHLVGLTVTRTIEKMQETGNYTADLIEEAIEEVSGGDLRVAQRLWNSGLLEALEDALFGPS